jgi:GNAT superfamily N-acetyltransferase
VSLSERRVNSSNPTAASPADPAPASSEGEANAVRLASFPADLETARALFREYERAVDAGACFESFEGELEELDRRYAPPAGRLLLAFDRGQPAGCAALRTPPGERAEACRLFVRAGARGTGLGGALVLRLLEEARTAGYRRVVLETLPDRMGTAVALYRALGFHEIRPYVERPVPGAIYMELEFGG